jgi:hypothetical protein
MNRKHINDHYTTALVNDTKQGYGALELHLTIKGETKRKRIARVIFWDAAGQYFLEVFTTDEIPLIIAEELIAEAKKTINPQ